MRKVFLGILAVIATGITVAAFAICFSPYSKYKGNKHRIIKESIQIDAKPEVVFKYLGNSSNAANWSVYVDHIVTLNESDVKDGAPGSIRRCFKQADEKGIIWDELITIVEPERKRQLTIFNMIGFPLQAEGLASEQLYEKVSGNKTRLTFTLFYLNEQSTLQTIKTYFAAYIVRRIFEKNLKNIKAFVEKNGQPSLLLQ